MSLASIVVNPAASPDQKNGVKLLIDVIAGTNHITDSTEITNGTIMGLFQALSYQTQDRNGNSVDQNTISNMMSGIQQK